MMSTQNARMNQTKLKNNPYIGLTNITLLALFTLFYVT